MVSGLDWFRLVCVRVCVGGCVCVRVCVGGCVYVCVCGWDGVVGVCVLGWDGVCVRAWCVRACMVCAGVRGVCVRACGLLLIPLCFTYRARVCVVGMVCVCACGSALLFQMRR